MKFIARLYPFVLFVSLCAAQEPTAPAVVAVPQQTGVTVLSYKTIGTGENAVSPADFEREMLYLRESSTPVISPTDYLAWRQGRKQLSAHAVLLTFEKTDADFAQYALPVLKRCAFPYMVMSGDAALPGTSCSQVTGDASFAHAVNFDSSSPDDEVLENVKACTPAVQLVPQNVVLPDFSDDDVAEDVSEEEADLVADPAGTAPLPSTKPLPPEVPEPAPVEPAPAEPAPAEPAPAEPVPAEPAPAEPAPAEPVPAEPAPAEPAPAEPVPAEPAPAEPAPAEPAPAEPAPAEPVPAEPVPTEPGVQEDMPAVTPSLGALGKRTPDGDWVTAQFKQPLVPREETQVAVLGYHNFSKTKTCTEMRMSTADFCRQMQFIKDSDICVISMQDFLEWRHGTRRLPAKCVLITIDDGWKSVYSDAYPVLKAYGYPFTLYLYTRYINVKGDSMTSEQIQEMMAHGATIGSHSSNHLYPSKWKRYKQDSAEYAAQLQKELVDSRTKLMSMFGNCSTYCYPGGYNTPPMHEVLGTAGYQAAFTVLEKKVQCEEVQFQVHRYMVFGTNHEIFRRAVNFGGQENVAVTRAAITAAEKPAREFFPAAFEGCTNMTVFAPPAPKKPAAKKTAVKKTAAKSKTKTTPKATPVPEAEPSPAPAAEPIPVGKLP